MNHNILDSAADRQIVYDGLDISLEPAPLCKRTLACITDMAVEGAAMYVAFFILTFIGGVFAVSFKTPVPVIAAFVILGLGGFDLDLYYWFHFEKQYGATVGKRIFGLKVISLDGTQLSTKQCLTRAGMRYIECLTIFPCLIAVLSNSKKQRLGDLMSGTMVVYSATREKDKDFMYLSQDRYYMLEDAWKPKELEQNKADDLVSFAFHAILMASNPERYSTEKDNWAKILKHYISNTDDSVTDDEELLRFFAQRAMISDNNDIRRQ